LIPIIKEIIEILFRDGLIKILFATETFAVGVNMPTRTVVFTELSKPNNQTKRFLNTAEYKQMSGRAGRRGKDTEGLVLYLPDREAESLEEVQKMMNGN
jgi:ATP-dependent RNA helicase DOB1